MMVECVQCGLLFPSEFFSFAVAEIGLNQTSYWTTESSGTVRVCAAREMARGNL